MRFPSGLGLIAAACVLATTPLAAQQQNGSKQNTATKSVTGSEKAEVRTERFKVKQEFGPQTVSRRGDKVTTVTPPSQGNSASGTGSAQGSSAQGRSDTQFNPLATGGTQKNSGSGGSPPKGAKPKSTSQQ